MFRRGWRDSEEIPLLGPFPACFSFDRGFSSPEELVETEVEKCREEGARGRAAAAAVWEVVVEDIVDVADADELALVFELARRRDWEWFEK